MHYKTGYLRDEKRIEDDGLASLFACPSVKPPNALIEAGELPPVLDQGATPMCVCCAAALLKHVQEVRELSQSLLFDASELYLRCKQTDGLPYAGTTIKSALLNVRQEGMLAEDNRYYAISQVYRCASLNEIKAALLSNPVILGIHIDLALFSATQSVVEIPKHEVSEGHAFALIGFDDQKAAFRIRNSWGEGWGEKGEAWLPYAYLEFDPAFDAWTGLDIVAPRFGASQAGVMIHDQLIYDPHVANHTQQLFKQLLGQARAKGLPAVVIEVYRSRDKQHALYCQGRSIASLLKVGLTRKAIDQARQSGYIASKPRITERLEPTKHGVGKAMDVAFMKDGHITYDAPLGWWQTYGKIAVSLGFTWGGNWKTLRDYGHVEVP